MATQKINRKVIINYLGMATGIRKGATVNDIIAATGLGRATVYRVINKTPAIKRLDMPGKHAYYWLDPDEADSEPVQKVTKVEQKKSNWAQIPVEPALVGFIMNSSWTENYEKLRSYTLGEYKDGKTKYEFDKEALLAAMQNSQDFQNGADRFWPELTEEARLAIRRLGDFGLLFYLWCLAMQQHPEFKSDENFWALWPKD